MHLGVIAVCLRKAANAKFLLVLSCEHVGAHHLLEELIDLRMHSFTHVRVHHVGRMHCPCALDMASSVNRKLLEFQVSSVTHYGFSVRAAPAAAAA